MSMRGGSHRASVVITVSPRQFEWDRCLLAVLRHTTLPWSNGVGNVSLRAIPLHGARQLGRRDRLSLLAQFAAHQGLLRFAGAADGELKPAEWVVVQKRGSDCRLVRIAATIADPSTAPPVLTVAQQFADVIGAPPLEVLRQSWARAESVYIEAFGRLRQDAAADLQWTRRSAAGALLAPGVEALREIAAGRRARFTYSDPAVIEAVEALGAMDPGLRVVVLRGGAIVRYGALAGLEALGVSDLARSTEAAIVERVAAVLPSQHVVFVIANHDSFDAASSRVVQMLASAGDATWIVTDAQAALSRTRWYVVAPRISAATELEKQIDEMSEPREAVDRFVAGADFNVFLDRGVAAIGDGRLQKICEPLRSYLAALSLLGERIDRTTAESFLGEFQCERPLEDLVFPGVSEVDGVEFRFVSAVARRSALELIPPSSRHALCRVAAAVAEANGAVDRAAILLIDAGEGGRAVEILERVNWRDEAALIEACDSVPRRSLAASHSLLQRYARALVRAARYRDARDIATMIDGDDGELVLARIERRTGDYGPALARLERLPRSCEADLLRAEILSVERRDEAAIELLRTAAAETDDERVQLAYALALSGATADDQVLTDSPSPLRSYYAARLATYRALDRGEIDEALIHTGAAFGAATATTQRIDVLMDQVFALFSSGRWAESRSAALAALAAVEETQGDRAAGGLLFLLAYLAADDGQWVHATQKMMRLRHFYGGTKDERRLAELDLIAAHLDFSRGRFEEAQRAASALLELPNDEPIRVAASLIVEEVAWISGRTPQEGVSREPANVEFADRWRLNALRRGSAVASPEGPFSCALAEWEQHGGAAPVPATGSEKLKLFRSAAGRARRKPDAQLTRLIEAIAAEMRLSFEPGGAERAEDNAELRLLRALATQPFPFAPHALGRPWRYVSRNRLGQWNEMGSLAHLGREQLDALADAMPPDWVACSDRELLQIEGIGSWSEDAREAVATAFRTRAELYRLQRVVDQEHALVRARPTAAGVIGDSPALRAVVERAALVARSDVAVCVLGESGTGKELIAQAIHAGSPRRSKPFTAVNCSAFPENLVESELFGHARGAFTGADRDRAGLIEASEGGTLFLDEIGEMPLVAQAKLLRFLQEGEFRRVGETSVRSADVRIVTATNRKLDEAVEKGRFREDLYYRIAGIEIVLPPLRDRGSDVLALATHFLALEHERNRSGPSRFSPEVEAILMAYSWPGNVRELQNTVRAAHAIAGDAKEIGIDQLAERLRDIVVGRTVRGSYQDAVTRFRRDLIERALAEASGNQNRAASVLKISRQALGYQIRELGILVEKRSRRTAL